MNEPLWLTAMEVRDFHAEQLAIYGGPPGVRDESSFESALGRPQNKWHDETQDFAHLAAAYAYGIARNHPFVDGNKRAAMMAMIIFLRLNGIPFKPKVPEAAAAILALAAGEIDESGLTRWIRDNWPAGA
jgi:death-on-curing protein